MPSPPPPPDPPNENPSPPTSPPLPPDPAPVKEPEPTPPPVKPPEPATPQEEPPVEVPPMEPPPGPPDEPPMREPPTRTPPIEDPPMPGVMASALAVAVAVGLSACPSSTPSSTSAVTPQAATTSAAQNASTLPTTTTTTASTTTMRPPKELAKLRAPPGFVVELFASDVVNARSLTLSPSGTVFVGTRKNDKVFAIKDVDKDGKGDGVIVVADGLDTPNGVAFHDGDLYVAEVSRILRFDDVESRLGAPQTPVVVADTLPKDKHHGWKFIGIGPDNKLYVPIGAPCNVCDSSDERFASITRMNLDGSDFQIVARGIRNTVGFDWQPKTNQLYFTENGADMMGDDLPPDELNRVPVPTSTAKAAAPPHFGFPYCHAGTVADPEHGKKRACKDTLPPLHTLGGHVAALGMRFYDGAMFSEAWRGQVFIAEHGSWNRSTKSGYRVVAAKLNADGSTAESSVFVDGWLEGDTAWGRPVDVQVMPDGALLISDDEADAIYRVRTAT